MTKNIKEKEEVLKKQTKADLAVGDQAVYVYSTPGSTKIKAISQRFSAQSSTRIKSGEEDDVVDGKWMAWDEASDNYPKDTWDKTKGSSLPLRMFDELVRIHFGGGLQYFRYKYQDGEKYKEYFENKEIDTFLKKNKIALQYSNNVIRDYYIWKLSPVELIIDSAKKKVVRVKAHDTMFLCFGFSKFL